MKRLVIAFRRMNGESTIDWISRLLTLNLLVFKMASERSNGYPENDSGDYGKLELDTYIQLVDQISRTCPRIETLQLFPVRDESEDQCSVVYSQLTTMTHLRSVTLAIPQVTESMFLVLGQLPRLEALSLWTSGVLTFCSVSIVVLDDSFTSLRQLSLIGLSDYAIGSVCKVAPLFRHLTRADIIFSDQSDVDWLGGYRTSMMAVKSMGQNSPHLQDLEIKPEGRNCGIFVVCLPVINAFKQMPLRRLRLAAITFDHRGYPGPEDSDDDADFNTSFDYSGDELTLSDSPESQRTTFLTAVPALEELNLHCQHIEPQEVDWIAALLPQLRLLVAETVHLDDVESLRDEAGATQPITIRSGSFFKSSYGTSYDDKAKERKVSSAAQYGIIVVRVNGLSTDTSA
ncbi:hypothetical protein FRC07_009254 [Ceratobasidium sp. 392]|nr:hypothetical protein FRC07_009254 [Ceratobasidium sp. 392]